MDLVVGKKRRKVEGGARNLGLFLDQQLSYRKQFNMISKQCPTTPYPYHLQAIWLLFKAQAMLSFNSLAPSKIRPFISVTMTVYLKRKKRGYETMGFELNTGEK